MVQYLQKMYPDRRFAAFQDLTGFKFLANKAAALESLGTYDVVLAYEEALGAANLSLMFILSYFILL